MNKRAPMCGYACLMSARHVVELHDLIESDYNKPLHTEPLAVLFGEIKIVRRRMVNLVAMQQKVTRGVD